jgi:tRNA G18 (ribose-2'-O)-methylase SpoU
MKQNFDLEYTSSQNLFEAKPYHFWNQEDAPILVGIGIRTPENMGGLIRLAGTMGCRKVIFAHESPLHNEIKIRKSSSTGHKHVDWQLTDLEQWKTFIPSDYELVAIETSADASMLYSQKLHSKTVFLVGDERYGLDIPTLKLCQRQVYIPLSGPVKSMNVVTAATVVLFELVRQQLSEL